jgi:hypothetical protein
MQCFEAFLERLRVFDTKANLRLTSTFGDGGGAGGRALSGMSEAEIAAAAAAQVLPREGAAEVLQRLLGSDFCSSASGSGGRCEVHVVSANWSDTLIRSALSHHFLPALGSDTTTGTSDGGSGIGDLGVQMPPVFANSLPLSAEAAGSVDGQEEAGVGRTTGEVTWRVASAGDKAAWLHSWDQQQQQQQQPQVEVEVEVEGGCRWVRLAIGDSVGDLALMVEAGLGVLVKESGSFKVAANALGLEVGAHVPTHSLTTPSQR